MDFLFYLFMNYLLSLMLLIPFFRLISEPGDEWATAALFCTSLLFALLLALLIQIKDALVDMNKADDKDGI